MDELEQYRRLRPETVEMSNEVRERVLARISELAEAPEPRWSRRRLAALGSLAATVALVVGIILANGLDTAGENGPPVAGPAPTSGTSQAPSGALADYQFASLPIGVTADEATEELVRLGDDVEATALVQRLTDPAGSVVATLSVVTNFDGDSPPFEDPAAGTLTTRISTPLGDGLLVQATEPGDTSVLYIVTTSGDLLVLSSSELNANELEALAQELTHR